MSGQSRNTSVILYFFSAVRFVFTDDLTVSSAFFKGVILRVIVKTV